MSEDTPAALPQSFNIYTLMQQNPLLFVLLLMVLGGQGYDIMGGQTSKIELQQLSARIDGLLEEMRDVSDDVDRLETRVNDCERDIQNLREERVRDLEDALFLRPSLGTSPP